MNTVLRYCQSNASSVITGNLFSYKVKGLMRKIFVLVMLFALIGVKGWGQTATFSYSTSGNQSFTVPANVYSLTIKMWGAGGAGGYYGIGGTGSFVTGTLAVAPGQVLTIVVGQGGIVPTSLASTTTLSYGGGGGGGYVATYTGGGGGGRSAIINSSSVELATAGGGGGGGGDANNYFPSGGGGGALSGIDGSNGAGGTYAGLLGTTSGGGAAGSGSTGTAPTAGTSFAGGSGGISSYCGGGGGGGYFGGGGGSGNTNFKRIGGGGGGASYVGGTGFSGTITAGTTGSNNTGGTNTAVPGNTDANYPTTPANVGVGGTYTPAAGGNGYIYISYVVQTNYYSKSTGNLDVLSTWGTNTDGSGTAPTSFTTAGQTFNIRNNAAPTIGAAWTVSGTSSSVVLGDGTNPVNFTVPATFAFTGTLNVSNNATFTDANATVPTFGTINANSTINFASTSAQTIPAKSFGNLTSSSTGARTLASSATIGVAGAFTPGTNAYTITGSTIDFSSASAQTIPSFSYYNFTNSGNGARTFASSGNINIAGTTFTPGTGIYTVTGSTVQLNGSTGFALTLPTVSAGYSFNTLSVTGTGSYSIPASSSTQTLANTLNISAGTFILNPNTNSSIVNTVSVGSINITGGILDDQSQLTGTTANLQVNTAWNQTSGFVTNTGTGVDKIVFTGGGNTTYTGLTSSSSFDYWYAQVSNNTTTTLQSSLAINGITGTNLTIDAGSIFNAGTYVTTTNSSSGAFIISGTFKTADLAGFSGTTTSAISSTNTPTITINAASTIEYNGAGAQTVSTRTDYSNLTFGDAVTPTTTNATPTAALTIGASVLINPGATFTGGTALTYNVAANWTNNGTFTVGTSTINLNGTAQTISGSTTPSTFYNLILAGSGAKTLGVATSVTGTETINSGVVENLGTYASNANALTLNTVNQSAGTYGGTGSGATYILPTYFAANTGVLTVGTSSCTPGNWLGNISTDWFNANNWCGGVVPTSTTNVVIPSGTPNQPIIGGAGAVCNNLTINSGATLTITGTNGISVSGNWANAGTFTPNSSIVTFNSSGSQTINNLTQAFYAITHSGAGTLQLVTNNLIVSNSVTNSAGTIDMNGKNVTSGDISGSGTITSNLAATATLTTGSDNASTTYSGIISNGTTISTMIVALTKTGTGILTLPGLSTYSGATVISAGTISANSLANSGTASSIGTGATTPAISIGATGVLQYTGAGSSSTRAITLTASGGTIDASGAGALTLSGAIGGNTFALVLTGTGTGTESGIIGTTTGTVTKNGTGIWTLSGTNTYTGGTLLNAGVVSVGADGNLGNTSGTLTFANGATLTVNTAFSTARAIYLNTGGGTLNLVQPLTLTGTVYNGGGISTGGNDLLLSEPSSTNNFGTININSGRVFVFNSVSNINGSTINVAIGGTLDFGISGAVAPVNTLNFASGSCLANRGSGGTSPTGTLTVSGATFPASGTMIFNNDDQATTAIVASNNFPLAGNITIQVGGINTTVGTVTLSGVISGASAAGLTKTLNGILILTGANTYTGATTISGGEFRLNPSANLSIATAIVLNGGILGTTNITSGRTITSSSTLQLAASSAINLGSNVHTLTFANSSGVTWNSGTLTINGWTGTAGASGTAGKIFVGIGGLSAAQLAQITFTGYSGTPVILASGEVVPPGPTLVISGTTNNGISCIGTAASPITYTITNTGAAASGLTVTSNNTQFVVSALSSTSIANGGSVTFKVTFTPSSAGTQNATITVASATSNSNSPTIALTGSGNSLTAVTANPSGATYCQNAPATALTVTATGTGTLTYQWYSNATNSNSGGTLITGATSATYTPSTAAAGTTYYYVTVTGTCGTATSNTAAVIVNATTTITGQPLATQTDCQNATPTNLTVTATGAGTLTYQWYNNATNSNSGGTLISGATSATYTPSTATVGTTYYYVIVTGTCGTATSNTAAVIVNATTTITGQPLATQTDCQNATPTNLTLTATGTGTLTYQWYSNATNSNSGGTLISGATSATYTPSTATAGTTYYYVIATGTCGTATSTTAAVIVNATTVITTQPAGAIYCPNATATPLSVVAAGAGTLTYQWYANTSNSNTGGTLISGATTSTYTPSTAVTGAIYYYVSVTGTCGTVTSNAAGIGVRQATNVTSNPTGATYCQNATATALTVTATGAGTLTYQWYSNATNSNSGGTLISGATSATYTPSTAAAGTTYYYVTVTGTCGTATSNTAAVIVNATTTITGQPLATQTDCQNATPTNLTVTATGAGTLTYQWYNNATNSNSGGTLISGATSATYTPSTATVGTTYYYVIVTGTCGTATSNTAAVIVNATTTITGQPLATQTDCQNATPTNLTLTATGTGTLTYQWYSNTTNSTTGGTLVATTATYMPSTATAGTVYYYVIVTGTCGAATSNTAQVKVNAPPTAILSGGPQTICFGNTASLTVTLTGTQPWSIVYNNGTTNTTVSGITSSPYTLSVSPTANTTYTLVSVSDVNGCSGGTVSGSATITFGPDTWTGNVNNDWNNANNWSCGITPNVNNDAVIPVVGSGHYPTVGTSGTPASDRNITVNPGASLFVTNQTLQISGVITNNGVFDVSSGTIELNGSTTQNIYSGTFTGNKIENLIISNNVTLNGADSLSGVLSFGSTNKTFTTNDSLTLRSGPLATAAVDVIGSSNAITGNVTVERYIATGSAPNHAKGWQLLAIPTSGSTYNNGQSIKDAWQEGASVTDVGNNTPGSAGNPHPGYGTMITSSRTTAIADGFDAYTPPGPSMKVFDTLTNDYDGPVSTTIPIFNKKGYFTFVRGDRSVTTFSGAPTPTILRTKGILFTPAHPPLATNIGAGKFESIGNPYAAPIDMRNITISSGVDSFFQVWDPRVGSSYNYGAFVTFLFDGTNYEVGTNGGGSYPANGTIFNYLQSGQAFFMQTAPGSPGTVTFSESAKAVNASFTSIFTRQASGARITSGSRVVSTLRTSLNTVNADGSTKDLVDGVLDQFDDSYSNTIDRLDARKMPNTGENLSIKTAGTLLVIERRHTIVQDDTIHLNLTNERVQQYRYHFEAQNMSTTAQGFVIDKYKQTSTPLNLDGTTDYDFSVENIAGSYAPDRFMIVFSPLKVLPVTFTSIKAYKQNKNIEVEWRVSNESNIKEYQAEKSVNGIDFTTLSVVKPTNNNGGSAVYTATDTKPVTGYNYYRIRSIDMNGAISYTTIVEVTIADSKEEININPNPITDGQIHLQFQNEPAGKYGLRLMNNLGQIIMQKQVTRQDGTSTELIGWNFNLAHGMYKLEVTQPDGTIKVINVLY